MTNLETMTDALDDDALATTTQTIVGAEADMSTMEPSLAMSDFPDVRFSIVDYLVFVLMLAVSVGIGVFSGWRSRHEDSEGIGGYLLGGRSMSPFAVALSLLGGSVSAIAILGESSVIYRLSQKEWS